MPSFHALRLEPNKSHARHAAGSDADGHGGSNELGGLGVMRGGAMAIALDRPASPGRNRQTIHHPKRCRATMARDDGHEVAAYGRRWRGQRATVILAAAVSCTRTRGSPLVPSASMWSFLIYSFKASHAVRAPRLRAQRTGMCPIAWTTCARSMSSPRVLAVVLLARCTVEGGYHLLCALFLMFKTRKHATRNDAVSAWWSRVTRPDTLAVGS